jgi:hypothetical protein
MAKAEKNIERVTTETVTFTLTLTTDEAFAVASLLGRVGGNRETSARKDTETVLRALEAAGVGWYGSKVDRTLTGHLTYNTRG